MITLMFLSFIAYIVLQIVCFKTLSGMFRKAAWISAMIGAAIIIYTLAAFLMQINLWPLLLLFSGPLLLFYVILLLVLRRLFD